MRWLGHVLRMAHNRIPEVALHLTPPGKRKRGRPRTTWRRRISSELEEIRCSMGQTQFTCTLQRIEVATIGDEDVLCPMKRISKKVLEYKMYVYLVQNWGKAR